jgi:hypothetical protein
VHSVQIQLEWLVVHSSIQALRLTYIASRELTYFKRKLTDITTKLTYITTNLDHLRSHLQWQEIHHGLLVQRTAYNRELITSPAASRRGPSDLRHPRHHREQVPLAILPLPQ